MNDPKPDLSRLAINRTLGSQARAAWPIAPRVIVLAIVAALFFIAVVWRNTRSNSLSTAEQAETKSLRSAKSIVMTGSSEVLNASGYVVAQRQAAVSSKATGRLKELRVVEGDIVKTGQVLGVLENDDLAALVRQEEANLQVIRAKLAAAEAELDDASSQFNRLQLLKQRGAVAHADFDEGQARLRRAQAEVAASNANLILGQARYDKAKIDLSYTNIVAPFDGTVLTKNADVGEIVAPFGSSADARAAIVTIADMSSLEVEADVSESNLTKVFVGQEAEIILDSLPSKPYRGFVSKIVPTVDRAKATVMTKIKFAELDAHVIPEMSAKVAFKLQKQ